MRIPGIYFWYEKLILHFELKFVNLQPHNNLWVVHQVSETTPRPQWVNGLSDAHSDWYYMFLEKKYVGHGMYGEFDSYNTYICFYWHNKSFHGGSKYARGLVVLN